MGEKHKRQRRRPTEKQETKTAPARAAEPGTQPSKAKDTTGDLERLLALQHSLGNRAVGDLLQKEAIAGRARGGPLVQILRAEEEEEDTAASTPEKTPADASKLGLKERLPGHGNEGDAGGQAEDAKGKSGAPPEGVDVEIVLSANPPEEERRAEADIAKDHNKPGVAGWTTTEYLVRVPHLDLTSIDVEVVLDFDIELAQEYSGEQLQVLRDHEYGHVNIGKEEAQEHLVDDLKGHLDAFPDFSDTAQVQHGLVSAGNLFEVEEGNASRAYDNLDYPRMQQAYYGARTPLADLEAGSPMIATAAEALRQFIAMEPPVGQDMVGSAAETAIKACEDLGDEELSRLQYNREFKHLVDQALIDIGKWNVWLVEFTEPDATTSRTLEQLVFMLEGFEWKPPV